MPLQPAFVSAAVVLALAAGPVLAQEQLFRTIKAAVGKQARLGIIANVTKECAIGPTLEVKVVTAPKQGTLAIRSGKTKAGSLKRCPTLEVPIQGVFYQANGSATGTDEVVYEIKRAASGTASAWRAGQTNSFFAASKAWLMSMPFAGGSDRGAHGFSTGVSGKGMSAAIGGKFGSHTGLIAD